MNRRRVLILGITAALVVAALAVTVPVPSGTLDLRIYDAVSRRAGAGPVSGRVTIVAIDDRSLSEIGQWPWSREVVATLIDRLHALGAAVVALDIIMAEPDRIASAGGVAGDIGTTDGRLAASLAEGRVIIGYAFRFAGGPASPSPCMLHPLDAVLVQPPGEPSPLDRLFAPSDSVCSLPALAQAASGSGYLNVGVDKDGIVRRLPLVMAFNGRAYPSFALAAVQAATAPKTLSVVAGRAEAVQVRLDDFEIPLGERGTLMLRFREKGRAFPTIPAADVLKGRIDPGMLKGQVVFVGTTAIGTQDVVSTPRDTQFPGIEVHATAADNLLRRDYVAPVADERAWIVLATLASGVTTVALIAGFGYLWGSLVVLVGAAAAWLGVLWTMTRVGTFVSPLLPTLAAAATLAVVVADRYTQKAKRVDAEIRRRQQAHEFILQSLTSLIAVRDPSTGRHARRTESYSRLLAQGLARRPKFRKYLTEDRITLMSRLAPLHDIGKVGIPDAILNKPGALSAEEWTEMQRHPGYGHETIAGAQQQVGLNNARDAMILQLAKDIVYTHHERWDGCGYPRGLAGEDIPIAGRIMAVVDVYDALTEERPYRPGMPHETAVTIIVEGRGTRYEPEIIDAFLSVADEFQAMWRKLRAGMVLPEGAAG